SSEDRQVRLWDTQTAAQVMAPLTGHTAGGIELAFNREGDRLLSSSSWDGQTRLWDTVSGRLLLTMPAACGVQFSRDEPLIGRGRSGTKLQLWRLADGRELRLLRRPRAAGAGPLHGPVLGPGGRTLAAASDDGLSVFDLGTGRELASARVGASGVDL